MINLLAFETTTSDSNIIPSATQYYNDLLTAVKGTGPTIQQELGEFKPGEKMQSTF